MRRMLLLAAALAIPASLVFVALDGGQAFAKTAGPKGKVTCTNLNGSLTSGTVTLSGCSDLKGANTGPGSHPISIAVLEAGGTITWDSGKTSTFSKPVLAPTKAKKCPGYVKSTKKNPYSGSEPSAEKFSGQVTADTSGLKVPGKYKGEVCISQSGSISALKALKAN